MKKTITSEHIEAIIKEKLFQRIGEKTTVCLLKLHNGFEVIGSSACVDKEYYSEELGKRFSSGQTCVFETQGFRVGFLSDYKNIISAQCV